HASPEVWFHDPHAWANPAPSLRLRRPVDRNAQSFDSFASRPGPAALHLSETACQRTHGARTHAPSYRERCFKSGPCLDRGWSGLYSEELTVQDKSSGTAGTKR